MLEGRTSPVRRHTASAETYVAYLKGRYHLSKFTVEGWMKAIECFDEATRSDSDYAPAYAGAAMGWGYLGLGENDLTFVWLEKAFEERNGEMVFLDRITDIQFGELPGKSIRDESRFSDLIQRMGLG